MVAEGALESIVGLTSFTDSSDVVSSAASLLLSIASNAPSLRPYLGRAGAIEHFIRRLEELVTSEGPLSHKYRLIDAICQCCRDVNNRIKVREQGGLSVLIDLLSNSKLTNIHDRIISAFVCFMYDDASIAVLLECRLVPALVSHLYRAAGIRKKLDFIQFESFAVSELLGTETTDADSECLDAAQMCCNDLKSTDDQPTTFPSEQKQSDDLLSCVSSVDFYIAKRSPDAAVLKPIAPVSTSELEMDNSQGKVGSDLLPADDEPIVSEPSTVDVGARTPRYSINSPTYKAVSAWRMELAADEDEESLHDRQSPRNIWEGARLYADTFSTLSSPCLGFSSPARSLGSYSDGLCSVRSWSSSLCDSSPQKSPGVSPTWSLDSAGSGMYSPFSNSSYVNIDGACSPSSFSDADEAQSTSLTRCDCSDTQLPSAAESRLFDSQPFQTNPVPFTATHSKTTMNVGLNETTVIMDIPTFVTDMSDVREQSNNKGTSSKFSSNLDVVGGDVLVAQTTSEVNSEEESSDDEFDVESFQRRRHEERRLSRLLDVANSMYASVETKPSLHSQQTKKRRRSASTSPSVVTRRKLQCPDDKTEMPCMSELVDLPVKDFQSSAIINDPDSCAQSLQTASDSNSAGEVNSDTESKASDDVTTCSIHHRNSFRVTERNILSLLSRISHTPETILHVINADTICGLLDYATLTSSPLPAAGKTLLRLSRSHHGFERALLCLFPVQAAWRMEPDLIEHGTMSSPFPDNSCSHHSNVSRTHRCFYCNSETDLHEDIDSEDSKAADDDTQSCKQEVSSSSKKTEIFESKKGNHCTCSSTAQIGGSGVKLAEAERVQDCAVSILCNEIIANLSAIAVSGYGQGVVSHLLLRGSHSQRGRCVISLCFLCRFVSV